MLDLIGVMTVRAPRDIVTRKALENACAMVAGHRRIDQCRAPHSGHRARGGYPLLPWRMSPRSAAHALHRNLRPGGQYHAKDVYEIGGTQVFIKELIADGFMHGDTLYGDRPHAGRGSGACALPPTARWCDPSPTPSGRSGGVVVLKGNL